MQGTKWTENKPEGLLFCQGRNKTYFHVKYWIKSGEQKSLGQHFKFQNKEKPKLYSNYFL